MRLAIRHDARDVRLIGSVVRGKSGAEIDLDLLIALDRGRTLLDHAALILELEALLGCTVDVATERGLRERAKSRVLQKVVPYEADREH